MHLYALAYVYKVVNSKTVALMGRLTISKQCWCHSNVDLTGFLCRRGSCYFNTTDRTSNVDVKNYFFSCYLGNMFLENFAIMIFYIFHSKLLDQSTSVFEWMDIIVRKSPEKCLEREPIFPQTLKSLLTLQNTKIVS